MLKQYTIKTFNLTYHLTFHNQFVLITGWGKTLLYQAWKAEKGKESNYIFLDDEENIGKIKKAKDNIVIIDNADRILDDELKRYISNNKDNQYIMFVHHTDGFTLRGDCLAYLEQENKDFRLEYY